MKSEALPILKDELVQLLEETFQTHHGIYTDQGTSLFETLEAIDAASASRVLPGLNESIAGHVFHTSFYIRVLLEYTKGTRTGKTDWSESWKIRQVTPQEWSGLVAELRAEYTGLIGWVTKMDATGDNIAGALAILSHCAYHLGAIRQIKDIRLS